MLKRIFTILCLLLTFFISAEPPVYQGIVYDDEQVAKLVTVITSTSPIPSIPNTHFLYDAQSSLFRNSALRLCKKIIVFDAVPKDKQERARDYEQYKRNVFTLTQIDPFFSNTELVFCPQWGHLSGAIEEALKHVKTPYVFIHQHDLVLQKDFDLNRALVTLIANPNVKYIHLSSSINSDTSWNGPVDDHVAGPSFIPLTRSFGWSDRTHLASVAYYKKSVLPYCDHCFMEVKMRNAMIKARQRYGKGCHIFFGAYLYGDLNDGSYISHTDGRFDGTLR